MLQLVILMVIYLYFDSFGVAPPEEILKLGEVIYNIYRIQEMDSNLVWKFCIETLLKALETLIAIINGLLEYSPNDYKLNDKLVLKRLNLS